MSQNNLFASHETANNNRLNTSYQSDNSHTSNNQQKGKHGEQAAVDLLEERGLVVIDQNFEYFSAGRGRKGEIDIIAVDEQKRILHFVEVKHRTTNTFGKSIEQISYSKIKSLRGAIEYFCLKHGEYAHYYKQIDIIGFDKGEEPTVLMNAVQFD